MSRFRKRGDLAPEDYEDLGLDELAGLIHDGDQVAERELRRRRLEEVRRLRRKHRFFVRFGQPGDRSRVGLDTEFVVTREGGLYDEHMAEARGGVTRWERGLSVYFAERVGGRAWVIREPDRRRASYQLGSGYLRHMLTGPLRQAIQAGEVYLVTGRLLLIDEEAGEDTPWGFERWGVRWPTYDVGSDGEPLLRNVKVVARLDPFGDERGVPKLLCCGYRDATNLRPLMSVLGLSRDDFQDDVEEEDEELAGNPGLDATHCVVYSGLDQQGRPLPEEIKHCGSQDECWLWIHKNQGQSVDWALRYGGYSIERAPWVSRNPARNADDELRRLERLARGGDTEAHERLKVAEMRLGGHILSAYRSLDHTAKKMGDVRRVAEFVRDVAEGMVAQSEDTPIVMFGPEVGRYYGGGAYHHAMALYLLNKIPEQNKAVWGPYADAPLLHVSFMDSQPLDGHQPWAWSGIPRGRLHTSHGHSFAVPRDLALRWADLVRGDL